MKLNSNVKREHKTHDDWSSECKESIREGETPEFMFTAGYKMFIDKYADIDEGGNPETVLSRFSAIADSLARVSQASKMGFTTEFVRKKFFEKMWEGAISPSTTVYANTGSKTKKGLPVSCSGNRIGNSIRSMYDALSENALLSKYACGTSVGLSDIAPRGTSILGGTHFADGVIPILDAHSNMVRHVSQGCYKADVQVFTNKGWKTFGELIVSGVLVDPEIRIAQVNDQDELEYVKPLAVQNYVVDEGESLVRLVSDEADSQVDMVVTTNHRMIYEGLNGVLQESPADELDLTEANFVTQLGKNHKSLKHSTGKSLEPEFVKLILERYTDLKSPAQCVYNFLDHYGDFSKITPEMARDLISVNLNGFSSRMLGDNPTSNVLVMQDEDNELVRVYSSLAAIAGIHIETEIGFGVNKITFHETAEKLRSGSKYEMQTIEAEPKGTEVYCFTVPTGKMFVRTHANGMVCGNSNRLGAVAFYLDVEHGDFREVLAYLREHHTKTNIGWSWYERTIDKLRRNDPEAVDIFAEMCVTRGTFGKGYIWKPDTAFRLAPQPIRNAGIMLDQSNLCSEIALPANFEYTFACVLACLNLAKKGVMDDDTIFWCIYMLDCVCSLVIEETQHIEGLEKFHKFVVDFRAVGMGVIGYHTMLQKDSIPFDSLQAQMLNTTLFASFQEQAEEATLRLGKYLGEPKWCKGTGRRNATVTAIPPGTSSSVLCGGVSPGIEPILTNSFNQRSAAGDITRVNPQLSKLLKEKGLYTPELIDQITNEHRGSVQYLPDDVLTPHEKQVFKTFHEIDQLVVVRKAGRRRLDQSTSLNIAHRSDPEEMASIAKYVLLDEHIKSAYYIRLSKDTVASTGKSTVCIGCEE